MIFAFQGMFWVRVPSWAVGWFGSNFKVFTFTGPLCKICASHRRNLNKSFKWKLTPGFFFGHVGRGFLFSWFPRGRFCCVRRLLCGKPLGRVPLHDSLFGKFPGEGATTRFFPVKPGPCRRSLAKIPAEAIGARSELRPSKRGWTAKYHSRRG